MSCKTSISLFFPWVQNISNRECRSIIKLGSKLVNTLESFQSARGGALLRITLLGISLIHPVSNESI